MLSARAIRMVRLSYKSAFPQMLERKLYKTGQTRGAEADEIFQNRVSRNSTVLVPLKLWMQLWDAGQTPDPEDGYENGHIYITTATEYFGSLKRKLPKGIRLGENCLVFYRTRTEWNSNNPSDLGWSPAISRLAPVGGEYIARVVSTTRAGDEQIFQGFTGTASGGVGAGIRAYEYCSTPMLELTRYQLALLAWHTTGMMDICKEVFGASQAKDAYDHVVDRCKSLEVLDYEKLSERRLLIDNHTICPLCLQAIQADELLNRLKQVEGREVADLTVTSANLFHVEELRPGLRNHRIYNLGWGHHHCNAAARDAGIGPTIEWMASILEANGFGLIQPKIK
jgi:hypothetical protein